MDLGDIVDSKCEIPYDNGYKERGSTRVKKRQENFAKQVERGLEDMEVS